MGCQGMQDFSMMLKEGCVKSRMGRCLRLMTSSSRLHPRRYDVAETSSQQQVQPGKGCPQRFPRVTVAHRTGSFSSARDAFVSTSSASKICVRPLRSRIDKETQVRSVLGASCYPILKHSRHSDQNSKLKATNRHTTQRTDQKALSGSTSIHCGHFIFNKSSRKHSMEER